MTFEFYEASAASPSGASAGIFIPRTDLPGVSAGELADSEATATKLMKSVSAIMNAVHDGLTADTEKLGLSTTRGNPTGTADNSFTIAFGFTTQYLASVKDDSAKMIPVPSTGTNSGKGKVALSDIFANAEIVAADGAISGEGVLIPFADLDQYGSPTTIASIATGADNRDFISALNLYLYDTLSVRATGTTSAVTAKTLGGVVGVTLAAAATDATNPTTGISASDLPKSSVYSRTTTITLNYLLNQSTQAFDVNIA